MPPKMTAVKRCESPFEAAFLRDFLLNEGIQAWDSNDNMSAWTGRYALLSRGCRVFVRPEDAQRALALLANPPQMEWEEGELPYEESEFEEEPATEAPPADALDVPQCCPNCGSANIVESHMPWPVWVLVNVLFFGLPTFFYRPSWVCRDCDWDSTQR